MVRLDALGIVSNDSCSFLLGGWVVLHSAEVLNMARLAHLGRLIAFLFRSGLRTIKANLLLSLKIRATMGIKIKGVMVQVKNAHVTRMGR